MSNIRWEDLVFANRNQAYGAYPLRRTYSNRVSMAFAFAMAFTALMLCYPVIKSLFKADIVVKPDIVGDLPTTLLPPPSIELIPVVPPPRVHVPVEQIRFVPPVVTQQEVEQLPPTIEELHDANTSNENIDGANLGIDVPMTIEPPAPAEDPGKVWLNVEQQPEFPGGIAEMMKFIAKNVRYPAIARRQGIMGNVFISFVVNPDGSISNVETIKGIHAECDNEAMRVIAKMPAWKPGKQNGKAVKVRFVVPIKFALTGV